MTNLTTTNASFCQSHNPEKLAHAVKAVMARIDRIHSKHPFSQAEIERQLWCQTRHDNNLKEAIVRMGCFLITQDGSNRERVGQNSRSIFNTLTGLETSVGAIGAIVQGLFALDEKLQGADQIADAICAMHNLLFENHAVARDLIQEAYKNNFADQKGETA